MKTEERIREDIRIIIEEAKEKNRLLPKGKKKKMPNTSKYSEMLKAVRVLDEEKVNFERKKLVDKLDKIEGLFPEYLDKFTAFRIKNAEIHKKKVRKEFNKVYGVAGLKTQLKWLNYLLEK